MDQHLEDIKYPIGRYIAPDSYTQQDVQEWIAILSALPSWLDGSVENLDHDQLRVPYREGGWTIQQLVHHLADSHMNAYIRLRLMLTEENPTIKPYNQDTWALLPDVESIPVNVSITLLHALHRRLVSLLQHLDAAALQRTYYHPEYKRSFPVWELVALYAWHSRHHFAQIMALRDRMGWGR